MNVRNAEMLELVTPVSPVLFACCEEPDQYGRHCLALLADPDLPDWSEAIDKVQTWLDTSVADATGDENPFDISMVFRPVSEFDQAEKNLPPSMLRIYASSKEYARERSQFPVLENDSEELMHLSYLRPGMTAKAKLNLKLYSFFAEDKGEDITGISVFLEKVRAWNPTEGDF